MSDLADLGAGEMLAAYRAGSLSPVEVTQAVIARIEVWEPRLNALYAYDPAAALEQARASETRWRTGEALALDGVPCTVKENIATAGVAMPLGTAGRELVPATADAPPAARLREAGCVILAKTTMPDFGMTSSGVSTFHGVTRNPFDLGRNPGGSSSGAGAAGAAGYGPFHVGTDIGGSIRLPAGWCGLVGLKPSFGRVPVSPPYWGRAAGPMTRTVTDAALMMRELSKPDARDPMSLPPHAIDWSDLAIEPKGLRLGLQLDAGVGLPVEPEVRATIEAAARAFAAAGAIVEPVAPFLTRVMLDGLDDFWRQRALLEIETFAPERRQSIQPYILQWAEAAAGFGGARVLRGVSQMHAIRDAALAASAPHDFVLSPVAPVPAFPAELASPVDDPARPFEHIAFTVAANMSEQPAISVHAGMTASGLPIGLQITGRRFDDIGVLALARLWEELRGLAPRWPVPQA